MINPVIYSSATDDWATPSDFFAKVAAEWDFDTDPCCDEFNRKANSFYYTKEDDGLSKPWWGNVWMNPPYGKDIGLWMKKANDEVEVGNAVVVVCLVPARTDTKWFHDYAVMHEVRFVKGRLRFGNATQPAPFPSILVIIKKRGN